VGVCASREEVVPVFSDITWETQVLVNSAWVSWCLFPNPLPLFFFFFFRLPRGAYYICSGGLLVAGMSYCVHVITLAHRNTHRQLQRHSILALSLAGVMWKEHGRRSVP